MNRKVKSILGKTIAHIIIIFFGVLMLYPILWLIASSFKSGNTIFSNPSIFSNAYTLQNYVSGWKGIAGTPFITFILNSIFICACVIVCNLVSCSMAAYAFSRLNFVFKGVWFAIMMITLMLPGQVKTIPQYVMFNTFHWVNTYLPLIIPHLFATDAFFVFLLMQFMRGLPQDLDESATIDGCGRGGIFLRIIIPLSGPALVTTALFSFLWNWDDFFNQLLYLNNVKTYTIPLGLRMFMDSAGASSWGSLFAMSVVALIPCFILFFALQKYFVQGIATTGLKG